MAIKERADKLLVDRGLAPSREKAQALILAGLVFSDGRRIAKSGQLLEAEAPLALKDRFPYVGRGGLKLEEALDRFGVDVAGLVAADIGSSTGGFTDCLLRRGARKVYAVDVDTRQLDWNLRRDGRVVIIEKNARYLGPGDFDEGPELVTVDVSFISLLKILPAVRGMAAVRILLPLIKPQFEAGRRDVGKKGIVRDPDVHREVLAGIMRGAAESGFNPRGLIRCSTRGQKGNVEFFGFFVREKAGLDWDRVGNWIKEAASDEKSQESRDRH